jgi:hypothetical protein
MRAQNASSKPNVCTLAAAIVFLEYLEEHISQFNTHLEHSLVHNGRLCCRTNTQAGVTNTEEGMI